MARNFLIWLFVLATVILMPKPADPEPNPPKPIEGAVQKIN